MTPEEYEAHVKSLQGEHDDLFREMDAGQSEPDAAEGASEPIPEPEMPAPDVPDTDIQDVAAIQSNQIPTPPPMATTEAPSGYPDAPEPVVQSNDIPEPPQGDAPSIESFVQEQRSKWSASRQQASPKPPDFDLREDSGMPEVGNMRQDLDDFAINMQSTYESVQKTFGVLSDVTGSHGRNVSDILARLMRQRIP